MKIRLTLVVEDDELVDEDDDSGLTEAAYNALSDAVADAGFSILTGPDKMEA